MKKKIVSIHLYVGNNSTFGFYSREDGKTREIPTDPRGQQLFLSMCRGKVRKGSFVPHLSVDGWSLFRASIGS